MVVVPIQVQVRLKDDFTIPVNTEPTSARAILVRNHWIFFEDMKKALEFLMDVADTKPDHKAFGAVAGNGTSNENMVEKIRNWAKRGRNY